MAQGWGWNRYVSVYQFSTEVLQPCISFKAHQNMNAVLQQKDTPEEWSELESDPGLFSLLVEEFGVQGVKVQEVYDITKKIETKVYGFVFLFRYELGDRRARKKSRCLAMEDMCYVLEPSIVNDMFFAHQIIINSCATHALLSVLLNCPEVELGATLTKLKKFSAGLDPESKGYAIANMDELACAHNKHARPSSVSMPLSGRKGSVVSSAHALMPETYHFVSYVPIKGRLFELDGLKEYPIDHGPWGEHEEWTDLFQRTIAFRLAEAENFMFNLMALIPDPSLDFSDSLRLLCRKQDDSLKKVASLAAASAGRYDSGNIDTFCKNDQGQEKIEEITELLPADLSELKEICQKNTVDDELKHSIARVLIDINEIESTERKLKEHIEMMQRYQIEHCRRIHGYEQFITEFVRMLAQNNKLPHRILKTTVTINSASHRRKKTSDMNKKPRTTLLVNGTKVN